MQNASYFCTGGAEFAGRPEAWTHYALSFDHYTHFTSPIRRYADILVHRLVSDVLLKQEREKGKEKGKGKGKGKGKVVGKSESEGEGEGKGKGGKGCKPERWAATGNRHSPWSGKFTDVIVRHCDQCNRQKLAAKQVQDHSTLLYFAALLQRQGAKKAQAFVTDLNGPRWMDVMVLEFGLDFRFEFKDDERVTTVWRAQSRTLDVFVKPVSSEGKEKEKEPLATLQNFSAVPIELSAVFKPKSTRLEIIGRWDLAALEAMGG